MDINSNKSIGRLLALVLTATFIIVNFTGSSGYRKTIIDGDGSGLYAYLPAIMIYHSVDFTPIFKFEKSRRPPDYTGHYFHKYNDTLIDKFTCGSALLQLPFFLLAYVLSLLFGLNADGYNIFFQYATALAGLFWAGTGLFFFVKLAALYDIRKKQAFLITLAGLFATNLFYYTFVMPSASHVYSFGLISAFLYFMKKVYLSDERRSMYISALILGLIVLVRPVNILVVFVLPFLAASPGNFMHILRRKIAQKDLLILIPLFLLGIFPQLLINFLQTGKLLVWGYQHEGFYFNRPEIIKFLFSYRKGWFVYTPFMLLLIPALVTLYKRSRFEFFSFFGFLFVIIYVFSSWWNWFYGNSFGMRPMVEFYALFLLIIILFISFFKRIWIKSLMWIFIGLTILLNLIQTYQYAHGIIHMDSMNKAAYWKVFLKTSEKYQGIIAYADESYYGKLDDKPFFSTINDMETVTPGWTDTAKTSTKAFSGQVSAQMDNETEYSPTFVFRIPDSLTGRRNLYIIFNAMIYEKEPDATTEALFITDVTDKRGETLFYKKFKVKKLPDKIVRQWRPEHIGLKLPEITDDMKQIKFYIWNFPHTGFLIDDMRVAIYTYN